MYHHRDKSQQKNLEPIGDALSRIALLGWSYPLTIRLRFLGNFPHESSQFELLVYGVYDQKLLSALLSLQFHVLHAFRLIKAHGVQLIWNPTLGTFDLARTEQTHTLINLILILTEYPQHHKGLDNEH
jgi:hypothetical protein